MTTILWLLFALFAVLQVLDIITTIKAIDGGAVEANPIIKALMDKIGMVPALLVSKAVIVAPLGGVVWFYPSTLLCGGLGGLVLFYGWVCWNNWKLSRLQ